MLKIFLIISSLSVFPFFSDSFWGAKYFLTLLLLPFLFFRKGDCLRAQRGGCPLFPLRCLSPAEAGFLIAAASIFIESYNFFQLFRFLAPFCLYLYVSRGKEEGFVKIAVMLTGLVSLLALLQQFAKYNPFNAPIPYVTFGNPMYMGAWLAAMLPFSADALLAKKWDRHLVALGASPQALFAFSAGFAALLLTRSQSAYMGFAAAMAYLLFKRTKKSKALIILTAGAAVSAIVYFSFFKTGDSGYSISSLRRMNYYRTSIEMIKDNPLKGVGAGNYRGNYARYRLKAGLPYHLSPQWAHCDAVHFMCELGIFRALLLFLFLISIMIKKIPPESVPYKAGILALVFTSFSAFPFQRISTIYLFFIFAGLIMREDNSGEAKYVFARKAVSAVIASAALIYALLFASSQINWKKGEKLLESGHPREAAAAFEKAAPVIPSDYRIWLDIGRAKYRSGNIGGSLSAYRRCLSLYYDLDICYNLSIAFKAGGNDIMAEKFMKDFERLKAR
ncbi:MAG: hypothetical protein CVU78_01070 [Elusimicrobia bacterium HGW-Elusimicrobia-2]|nr:MAG: hypothetical protein CVU78_01070 [Elusimicrobia bacterium HGW-Elusimicrobia-2]